MFVAIDFASIDGTTTMLVPRISADKISFFIIYSLCSLFSLQNGRVIGRGGSRQDVSVSHPYFTESAPVFSVARTVPSNCQMC
jgi:hypothetical protein